MNRSRIRKHPLYKLIRAFIALAGVLVIAVAGFMIIEHFNVTDAFYMAIITISTVGFGEVHPLSEVGKWFTMVLIVINLSLLTYIVSYITQYFLDGNFQRFYKRYKMTRAINELHDHVIICGFGRNGKAAARLIMENKIPVVVLERHETQDDDDEHDFKFLFHTDATNDEALLAAGIEHARGLITTLPDDADNLFIVLTARELNPRLQIISRASNDSTIRKLKSAGANEVIMPDKIGGMHMATLIINPSVKAFIDYMSNQVSDVQVNELTVKKSMRLSEMDCWKNTGATVLGMRNSGNNYVLNPPGETILAAGDCLIVLGDHHQIKKVEALMNK